MVLEEEPAYSAHQRNTDGRGLRITKDDIEWWGAELARTADIQEEYIIDEGTYNRRHPSDWTTTLSLLTECSRQSDPDKYTTTAVAICALATTGYTMGVSSCMLNAAALVPASPSGRHYIRGGAILRCDLARAWRLVDRTVRMKSAHHPWLVTIVAGRSYSGFREAFPNPAV